MISRWLVTIGFLLVVVGLLWPWLGKLGLGRLPGDIVIEREISASISRYIVPRRQPGRVADLVALEPMNRSERM